jgi:hypothetical protein
MEQVFVLPKYEDVLEAGFVGHEGELRCFAEPNQGELVLVAEVPRPTVAELMRMHPSMEPVADSGLLQLYLPLSAFL